MKKLLALSVVIMAMISACQKTKPVARVGNQTINLMEFRTEYQNRAGSVQTASLQDKMQLLEQLVDEKLLAQYAKEQGVTEDSLFQYSWNKIVKGQVYRAVIDDYVLDNFISESMIKDRYRLLSKEHKVRHIFIPDFENSDLAVKKLQALLKKIQTLDDFIEQAKIHSRDSLSSGQGGLLGYIQYGSSNFGRDFEMALSEIRPNRVSQVIQSPKGYHLVWIENERPRPQQPYDLIRKHLRQEIFNEMAPEINQRYSTFIEELKNRYQLHWYNENIKILANNVFAAREKKINESPQDKAGIVFSNVDPEIRQLSVISYDDAKYTIGDYLDDLAELPAFQVSSFQNENTVRSHLERILPSLLILQLGYDKGYNENYEVLKAIDPQKEKLLAEFARKRVNSQVKDPSEQDLRDHYMENQQDFIEPAKANVQEIAVVSLEKANRVVKEAKYVDFTELVEKYSENQSTKRKKGMIGYITADQMGNVGQKALELSVGQISDPIENGNHYSVIKVIDKKESQPRPFSQVQDMIYKALKAARQQQAINETVARLKSQMIVQVYEHILEQSL